VPCEGAAEKGVEASNFRAFSWPWGRLWRGFRHLEPPTTTTYSFLLLPAKVRKSPRNFETSKPFHPSYFFQKITVKARDIQLFCGVVVVFNLLFFMNTAPIHVFYNTSGAVALVLFLSSFSSSFQPKTAHF